jgi:hypothetical protein
VLQPVQRALAGQRGAAGAARLQLAGEHGQHRVVPQPVVVDQVLVAKRDAKDALPNQGGDFVLDPLRRPRVAEACSEATDQPDGPVRGAEQKGSGIGGDRPAIEASEHTPVLDGCELEQRRATIRLHRGASSASR